MYRAQDTLDYCRAVVPGAVTLLILMIIMTRLLQFSSTLILWKSSTLDRDRAVSMELCQLYGKTLSVFPKTSASLPDEEDQTIFQCEDIFHQVGQFFNPPLRKFTCRNYHQKASAVRNFLKHQKFDTDEIL